MVSKMIQEMKLSKTNLVSVLNLHKKTINSLLLLKDERLVSTSDDNTIIIWDLKKKENFVLSGHEGPVFYAFQLQNGHLVSCSEDCTIRFWDLEKQICISNFRAHEKTIVKVIQLSNKRIASCSFDKKIKIWKEGEKLNNESLIKVLEGHEEFVTSVLELKNKNYIVSGGRDSRLRFWSSADYTCKKVIDETYCQWNNSIVELDDEKLLIGYFNQVIVVNLKEFQIETKIVTEKLNDLVYPVLMSNNNLILGCKENIFFLNSQNFQLGAETIKVHDKEISCLLVIKDQYLITGSLDNTIKVWDLSQTK